MDFWAGRWYSNVMLIPKTPGFEQAVVGIYDALDEVVPYPTYGNNESAIGHLKTLALDLPPGVKIEVEPVAYQTRFTGDKLPLHRVEIDLGFDGRTLDGCGGVDCDELVWRGTFQEIGNTVVRNPDMWRAMGVSRIGLQESERAISDTNTWHQQYDQRPISSFLLDSQRGTELVSYGCSVEHRGYSFSSNAPGAIACQEMIKEHLPDMLFSYDNSAVNGPYGVVDNPPEGLAYDLSIALESMYDAMPFGTTDIQPTHELAPGIFAMPRWQDLYDHYDAIGAHDNFFMNCGEDIFGYARRMAHEAGRRPPVGGMIEPPYYIAHNLPITWKPSGLTRGQFHRQQTERLTRILDMIDVYLPKFTEEAGYVTEMAAEIGTRVKINQSNLNALGRLHIEQPDRGLSVSDVANLSRAEFYALKPLGLLARLAHMLDSEHLPAILDQFEADVAVVEGRLRPAFDSPRRAIRVQLGTTMLTALAVARTED